MNTRGNIGILASALIFAACGGSNFKESTSSQVGNNCPAYGCNVGGDGSAPTILSFNPATGSTLPNFPTQVQVYFSENMDTTTVESLSNWNFQCSTGSVTLSSVVATSPVSATVYAQANGLMNNSACTLNASRNITDASGTMLAGQTTAAYTIGSGGGGGDVTPPTGDIVLPWNNDRIFGSVLFSATATDSGTGASGVQSVAFYLDNTLMGTATSMTNGKYQITANTNMVSNGPSTLSIRVTDNAGNVASQADSISVFVQNHNQYTSSSVGGSGGNAFTDSKSFLSHMYGFRVQYTGTGVTGEIASIQPQWKAAYSSDRTEDGSIHGGGGTTYNSQCPSTHRVSGFWLKAGNVITRIGLICSKYTDGSDRQLLNRVGGTSGTEFTLECPTNTFVKALKGKSGSRVDSLQVVCQ